jgi:hypothetical protein
MMTTLEALRDDLAAISGVLSCKIGREPGVSPADFPLIRLVPERVTPGKPYGRRTVETLIFFGVKLDAADGLESVYEALFTLEASIIAAVRDIGGVYVETITDRDEIELPYKLMAIRCNLTGAE